MPVPLEKRLAKFLYTYLDGNGYANSFIHRDFKDTCVDGYYDLEDLAESIINYLEQDRR